MDKTWIKKLMLDEGSKHSNLREHLLTVHKNNPGFTESCAQNFKNEHGRSSYHWLAELIRPNIHKQVLDLGCGSGPLLEICDKIHGGTISLIGVDMSEDELALAKKRLDKKITLFNSTAQNLSCIGEDSVDVVLCHWALTLMDPLEPVFKEIKRVLRSNGVFGAIVDGNHKNLPQYKAVHNIIYSWAQTEYSNYGNVELGDVRTRDTASLLELVKTHFKGALIIVEHDVLELTGEPSTLAKEVSGFFYATFVLTKENKVKMLKEIEKLFESQYRKDHVSSFKMPINRLKVTTL